MAALEAKNIAHLPGKTGASRGRRTGARATQRNHEETFRAGAAGGARGQRRGVLGASAAQHPGGGERQPRVRIPLRRRGGSHFPEFSRSVRFSASRIPPGAALPAAPAPSPALPAARGGGGGGGESGSGRPDPRRLLRDRSHDTGKSLQDGSRYPARLGGSGAHPPPAPPRLPPPPRLPSPRLAGLPFHTSSPAGARPFGRTASPGTRRREGRWRRGPGPGARGEGRARGASASALPAPGAPRDRRLPRGWSFVLSLPTTCLSRGPEGPQRTGRSSRRGSPSTSEGSARVSLPPCHPASPLLSSSFVASTPGHDTAWAVSPLPLGSWQCGRTANTILTEV
ncbi:translation initiation factor IF-2-like [Bubalus bubalis]|uniref:translation initiation factor IF-2-like n=1 Tax=Bubalus bubalis TaxID=89462 RepID=UPI001D1061A6|nr:translation initiation factor IF-2-like [Bubalus bubalis]